MKRSMLLSRRHAEWLSLLFWLAAAVMLVLAMGCGDTGSNAWQRGQVVFVDLENGFYGIVRDDGEKLVPQPLPEAFGIDSLRVRFQGEIDEESLTLWGWGKLLRLDAIESDPDIAMDAWITGTVRYIDLEGGFYGIIADDGTAYLPRELENAFHVDGRRVRFTGTTATDWASMYQWGSPFDVHRMEGL